jgi:hypothetical protein
LTWPSGNLVLTLAIRYCRQLLDCPSNCDGCRSPFTLRRALSCKKGGLIIRRHNEVRRDTVGDLSALFWKNVTKELIVREAQTSTVEVPALIADLGVRGAWEAQRMALLDIRVTDTDALSYATQPVRSILAKQKPQRRRNMAVRVKRGQLFSHPL